MKSYRILTVGCKVNAYESQAMKEILDRNGYCESEGGTPDLVIVNSCAVTQVAERKSRQKVSSFAKRYPSATIVVCGCSSQLHPEGMAELPHVSVVMGNNNHAELLELLERSRVEKTPVLAVDAFTRKRTYQRLSITGFDEKVRAFVKIGDGCDNFCAYCIIPKSRGNLRSRAPEEILCEIRALVRNGYQEIVITGIDSASYGKDLGSCTFDDLLEEIAEIEGLKRLRISSVEASQIDERFVRILKRQKNILPHLHLPLQSGSDAVLKRMRRKYTCAEFLSKIRYIREEIPDIALACDVIVGFPGETDAEFEETYRFIETCGFAFLHVFPYSPREGTFASTMKDQVPDTVKKQRAKRLIALGDALKEAYASRFVGRTVEVLFESRDPRTGVYRGRSEHYLEVSLRSGTDLINRIVPVVYRKEEEAQDINP